MFWLVYLFYMGSSIGKLFKLTTYGESHGLMIGGVVEGCPSRDNPRSWCKPFQLQWKRLKSNA